MRLNPGNRLSMRLPGADHLRPKRRLIVDALAGNPVCAVFMVVFGLVGFVATAGITVVQISALAAGSTEISPTVSASLSAGAVASAGTMPIARSTRSDLVARRLSDGVFRKVPPCFLCEEFYDTLRNNSACDGRPCSDVCECGACGSHSCLDVARSPCSVPPWERPFPCMPNRVVA